MDVIQPCWLLKGIILMSSFPTGCLFAMPRIPHCAKWVKHAWMKRIRYSKSLRRSYARMLRQATLATTRTNASHVDVLRYEQLVLDIDL